MLSEHDAGRFVRIDPAESTVGEVFCLGLFAVHGGKLLSQFALKRRVIPVAPRVLPQDALDFLHPLRCCHCPS